MFKLNIQVGLKQILMMTYMSSSVAVEVTKLIDRRELNKNTNSMDILVRYLEFTNRFDQYYNMMVAIHDDIITLSDTEITEELDKMLELFDNDSIEKFLDNEKYQAPNNLIDEFTNDIILNREGSREQTYTKKDYRDLVLLSIKFKSLAVILARYVAIHGLNVNGAEAVRLYRIIDKLNGINKLPGYLKLIEFIKKNIAGDDNVTRDDIARIIVKGITNTQFTSYIALGVIIYMSIAGTPDNDTPVRNMVNEIFRLCRNKITPNNNIIINDPGISIDDEGGSSSVTDAYLSLTEIPIGHVEEIQVCYGNMELIIAQTALKLDRSILDSVLHLKDVLITKPMDESQIAIICWLFVDTIESQYIEYLTIDTITDFRLLAYTILKTYEIDTLADVMLASTYEVGGYLSKNASGLASEELENKLQDMYSISINKKSRNRKYGLSILEDSDTILEDGDLKELLIKPVIRRISTTKWLCYNLPKDSNVISCSNARTEILKMMSIVYDNM